MLPARCFSPPTLGYMDGPSGSLATTQSTTACNACQGAQLLRTVAARLAVHSPEDPFAHEKHRKQSNVLTPDGLARVRIGGLWASKASERTVGPQSMLEPGEAERVF